MEKKMNIILHGLTLSNYSIVIDNHVSEAIGYAARELQRYLQKMIGYMLPIMSNAEHGLVLQVAEEMDDFDDSFYIRATDTGLLFYGYNERGLIYAVYDFLEQMGYRFFSCEFAYKGHERGNYMGSEEYLFDASDKDIPSDYVRQQHPVFNYRDAFTYAVTRDVDYVKFRLNAESWQLHTLCKEHGGGLAFCGSSGHSFSSYVSTTEYYEQHPEYFALIDGERKKNISGGIMEEPQLCLTNDELSELIAEKMIARLRKNPKHYISLSQSDNASFCQCEKCRASYEKYGYFGTLMNFVNRVARIVKVEFPKVMIHTYAYARTADVDGRVVPDDNVLVQYCPRPCHMHALDDSTCEINRIIYQKLNTVGNVCKNLMIYDYRSCLTFALMMLPDIEYLRTNMQSYAGAGVTGIYGELNIFSSMQPTMEELRLYLFSKLTWNPYMSEEEYERHICEFLEGFYGKNWKHIREFIRYYGENVIHAHLDSFCSTLMDDNLKLIRKEDGKLLHATLFPKEKESEILRHLNELLDKAKDGVAERYAERIEIIRTGILWYELYHNMDDILEHGTEEEKQQVIERNRDLCIRMRKYCMKYTTFIGLNNTSAMYDDFSVSPSKWNYNGFTEDDVEAFNMDSL